MKVLSCNIELDKLKSGSIPQFIYADVELDMDREDKRINTIRIPLEVSSTFYRMRGRYASNNDYQTMTRIDFLPIIKEHIGAIIADKLFEGEEALQNLGK